MKITATVYTDDQRAKAEFDSIKWFEQASDSDLQELIDCEFGRDYIADEVAEFCNNDANVAEVFSYLNSAQQFFTMGFECVVDSEQAMRWIEENKSHILS